MTDIKKGHVPPKIFRFLDIIEGIHSMEYNILNVALCTILNIQTGCLMMEITYSLESILSTEPHTQYTFYCGGLILVNKPSCIMNIYLVNPGM